ncbi:hypothetical protein HF863_02150 [Lactobacillus agilis]|uniref:Uncharacterized protein n=1 Tax=Ligilactobacillus agilis TaxID=1601 RepID=A0A848C2F5_9LACO|nr:hypothetical protein [Ligilactobacillus agilis]NME41583.1 hypothetical protein [Ligilactobacillus agilis]
MDNNEYLEKLEMKIINVNTVLEVAKDKALEGNVNEVQGLLLILFEVTDELVNEIYSR